MAKRGKLELTWVGKDERVKLEPRVLVEDSAKSYGDPNTENMLIYGDNLLALKALEQNFAGNIKCIYIDPPFNTGSAFEHYDDNLEHSIWLSMMKARLEILKTLLTGNGVIYVHIDDIEFAYLKVLLDEVFGRGNFISQIAWERSAVAGLGLGGSIINVTEYILCYARNKNLFSINEDYRVQKDFPIEKLKGSSSILQNEGKKQPVGEFMAKSTGLPVKIFQHSNYIIERISFRNMYQRYSEIMSQYRDNFNRIFRSFLIQKENQFQHEIIDRIGKGLYSVEYTPSRGKYKGIGITIYYLNGELVGWLRDNAILTEEGIIKNERVNDFWTKEDISNAARGEGGIRGFDRSKKPEELLQRIVEMSTSLDDWVLDSFLGSGTTAAVAHKLGRKWIGIELGEHAETLCLPRLKRVVSGEDQTGISKEVNWQGGGGFKYYRLAESLLVRDKELSTKNHPVYIINLRYDEKMLIRAICKIENFRYRNEGRLHGISSESRFLHITTSLLTHAYLDSLAEDIGPEQSLLIYCTRRKRSLVVPDNIEIKKIPRDLLRKCDFQEDVK